MDVTLIAVAAGLGGAIVGYGIGRAKIAAERLNSEFWEGDARRLVLEKAELQKRYDAASIELASLQVAENQRQAQRSEASRKAAEVNRARAVERKQAAGDKTAAALTNTKLRPRDQVVATVRQKRKAKKSGAGGVAAKQGG